MLEKNKNQVSTQNTFTYVWTSKNKQNALIGSQRNSWAFEKRGANQVINKIKAFQRFLIYIKGEGFIFGGTIITAPTDAKTPISGFWSNEQYFALTRIQCFPKKNVEKVVTVKEAKKLMNISNRQFLSKIKRYQNPGIEIGFTENEICTLFTALCK